VKEGECEVERRGEGEGERERERERERMKERWTRVFPISLATSHSGF